MIARSLFAIACLSALAACGSASASTLDPSDDLHCSVVAFYFKGLAEHKGAPADQLRATAVVDGWYAAKVREIAPTRWKDLDASLTEMAPILEAVKADPMAASDEHMACAKRATEDPSFAAFSNSPAFAS